MIGRIPTCRRAPRLAMVLGLLLLGLAGRGVGAASADPAFDTVKRMGRGINILGYDGIWDGGVDAPFKFRNFRRIRDAGFQHVRVNLHAFKYMDGQGKVDPVVLGALDDVIVASIAAGLIPVLDEHNSDDCQQDVAACRGLLSTFWKQIAERYRGKYPALIFELLNEPGGRMSHADWNELAQLLLGTIRAVDQTRTVIIAALNSEEPGELRPLDLPRQDRRIILTVHYYKPFEFTHQGAPWIPDGPRAPRAWGSEAEKAALAEDMAAIDRWARSQGRPVYLGEFGVYDAAETKDRISYMSAVARAAERNGWAWAAWQFDHDFAVFNSDRDAWNAPLLRALIP